VMPDSGIREIILEISSKRLGCTAVVNNDVLEGIITDGDLRRMLQSNTDVTRLKAADILSRQPLTIAPEALVSDALDLMRSRNITQLLVVEKDRYMGVLHLHDILREGII
jgi:arabinose-5-phosphate isomerase